MGDIDVRAVRTNIKRTSAIAPSLASACTKLGLDYLRPSIRLDEATEVLLKQWKKADTKNKVLIFTKSVKLLEMLEFHLSTKDFKFLKLDGSTKQSDRKCWTLSPHC